MPVIQEVIQRINTILDEITTIEEPQSTKTPHLEHMPELEDIPSWDEQAIPYNPEVEEEEQQAWNKLHFNSDQHTVQEFAQELDLATLIGTTNAQIIDKFKECFPPEIESQLLDINDLDCLVT